MNNPVMFNDLSGLKAGDVFATMSEAAIDWAKEYYGVTAYILLELSSVLYRVYNGSELIGYAYTEAFIGNPHDTGNGWASVGRSRIPDGQDWVGAIHSHPNGIRFSDQDKVFAENYNITFFVVVPSVTSNSADVLRYSYHASARSWKAQTIATDVIYTQLTAQRKADLARQYHSRWETHLNNCTRTTCIHGSWTRRWPNP